MSCICKKSIPHSLFLAAGLLIFLNAVHAEELSAAAKLEQACRQGQADACNEAGSLYLTGEKEVTVNHTQAQNLFKQACTLNLPLGCMNLATLNLNGLGGPQDFRQALFYYQKACSLGENRGCSASGYLLLTGSGVSRNPLQAEGLLIQACQADDAPGCLYLGALYAQNNNWEKAISLYRKACTLHEPESCNLLFSIYKTGSNVKQDLTQALNYAHQACELGYAQACTNEGVLYLKGECIMRDSTKALALFEKACELVNVEGCFNAAYVYEQDSAQTNSAKASEYYDKACRLQNETACLRLERLNKKQD